MIELNNQVALEKLENRNLNLEIKYPVTDLLYAIEQGNMSRIKNHLDWGTPLNEPTCVHRNLTRTYTALEYAMHCGKYNIFELLLRNGGKPTDRIIEQSQKDPVLREILERNKYKTE